MNKKTIHISTLGSCVSRDSFEICKNSPDYDEENENCYVIDRYAHNVNPLSYLCEPFSEQYVELIKEELNNSKSVNFKKRNFIFDLNKGAFDFLAEKKSEWLIVDLAAMRFELIKIAGGGYIISEMLNELLKNVEDRKSVPSLNELAKGEIKRPADFDREQIQRSYKLFFDKVLSLYKEDRIILLQAKHALVFVNESTREFVFDTPKREQVVNVENQFMCDMYDYAKSRLKKAHFIPSLPVLIGNREHKWGISGLHYVDEVYSYFYRAIDFITNNRNKKIEDIYISNLQNHYSNIVFSKYSRLLNKFLPDENLFNTNVKEGKYECNGIEVTINKNFNFEIKGSATEDTVFFLITNKESPLLGWGSINKEVLKGKYIFKSGIKNSDDCFVQLVFTEKGSFEKRWLLSNDTCAFNLDKEYGFMLVRLVIKKGTYVDQSGRLFLKRIV